MGKSLSCSLDGIGIVNKMTMSVGWPLQSMPHLYIQVPEAQDVPIHATHMTRTPTAGARVKVLKSEEGLPLLVQAQDGVSIVTTQASKGRGILNCLEVHTFHSANP